MAVKFIRTCDRCGKVIREGNANSTLTVGEGNSLNFYTKDEHKSYDICDECAEAFEKFMTGWVSLRDALSEDKCDSPALYANVDRFGRGTIIKEGIEYLNATIEENQKDGPHAYHKWTKDEDAFLIEERDRKVKTPKIAEKLGLSVSQVRSRIKYLDALRKEKKNVKNESDGWSDEVLEMARKHNEQITAASIDSEPIAKAPSKDKTEVKLAPGTHTYHQWTAEEDRAILKSPGKTLNDLACQFGTTIAAVRARKHLILNGKVDINRED